MCSTSLFSRLAPAELDGYCGSHLGAGKWSAHLLKGSSKLFLVVLWFVVPLNPIFGPFQVGSVDTEDGKGLSRPCQGSSSAPLRFLRVYQKESHMNRVFRLSVSYRNGPQQRRPHSSNQVFFYCV